MIKSTHAYAAGIMHAVEHGGNAGPFTLDPINDYAQFLPTMQDQAGRLMADILTLIQIDVIPVVDTISRHALAGYFISKIAPRITDRRTSNNGPINPQRARRGSDVARD